VDAVGGLRPRSRDDSGQLDRPIALRRRRSPLVVALRWVIIVGFALAVGALAIGLVVATSV
jgi:hypothetical protein